MSSSLIGAFLFSTTSFFVVLLYSSKTYALYSSASCTSFDSSSTCSDPNSLMLSWSTTSYSLDTSMSKVNCDCETMDFFEDIFASIWLFFKDFPA